MCIHIYMSAMPMYDFVCRILCMYVCYIFLNIYSVFCVYLCIRLKVSNFQWQLRS